LKPHVAALPVGTRRINICTATPEVLASIGEGITDFGDTDALARNREDGCFPTVDDLRATLDDEQFQLVAASVAQTSNWFRATSIVSIGTSQLTLYSLLERNS